MLFCCIDSLPGAIVKIEQFSAQKKLSLPIFSLCVWQLKVSSYRWVIFNITMDLPAACFFFRSNLLLEYVSWGLKGTEKT